jgi:hypothetical protein
MTSLVVAVAMGYLVSNNHLVEKQASGSIGASYAIQALALMSYLGAFGGWFCIIPAAIIVANAWDNSFLDAVYFVLAALAGAFIAGLPIVAMPIRYLLSPLTLPINIALVLVMYFYFN